MIAVLFAVALWILVLVLTRNIEGSWWGPSSIAAVVIGVSSVVPAILERDYPFSLPANVYLVGAIGMIALGSLLSAYIRPPQTAKIRVSEPSLVIRHRRTFLIFGLIVSTISLLATVKALGLPTSAIFSMSRIESAAKTATQIRYGGGLNFPLYYNVANGLVLAYVVALSVHMVARRRIDWVLLIPIVPYILSNVLITVRAPIIAMLTLAITSGMLTARWLNPIRRFPRLMNRRTFGKVILGILFIGIGFYYVEVLRYGFNSPQRGTILTHLVKYVIGNVPAFEGWFSTRITDGQTPTGFYTFMGIYSNLHIAARQVGTYSDYYTLAPNVSTNVYTVFRGLITDFGFAGSYVIVFVVGVLGGWASRLRFGGFRMNLAVYIGIASFLAFSPIVSFWSYTSFILAIIIGPLLIGVFARPISATSRPVRGMRALTERNEL
jgi:oligosaccharide repeat unit polymerase